MYDVATRILAWTPGTRARVAVEDVDTAGSTVLLCTLPEYDELSAVR
eukprot:COSAG02_NODE_6393_length_3602_cov_8.466743_1_plen_47_part_00